MRHQCPCRRVQSVQTAKDSRAAPSSQGFHPDLLPELAQEVLVPLQSQRELRKVLAVQADVHVDFSTQHLPDHC
jgi:hypothetical protein